MTCVARRAQRLIPQPAESILRTVWRQETARTLRQKNGFLFPVRNAARFPPARLPGRRRERAVRDRCARREPMRADVGVRAELNSYRAAWNHFPGNAAQRHLTPVLVVPYLP